MSKSQVTTDWPTVAPATLCPNSTNTFTPSPTTTSPTPVPSNNNSTTASPTAHPTDNHQHHHHSKQQEWEIDSSVVVGFLLCVLLALVYRKRKRLPDYFLKLKYYLCCCRISIEDLIGQQRDEQHTTLNDFIFEVDDNDHTARVNMSGLTTIGQEGGGGENDVRQPETSAEVLSIQSIFPDLLGGQSAMSRDDTLDEPLIRSTRHNNNRHNS